MNLSRNATKKLDGRRLLRNFELYVRSKTCFSEKKVIKVLNYLIH